jgi:transcriptional regulator with XRE-family HTH domain
MKESPVAVAEADINTGIAARVRGLRSELDLTLEELAERSGVSRSMLSLVERAESSPTAVVLHRIATGLGVPLASLFDEPGAPPDPLSRSATRTTWRDPETGYTRRNVSPPGFPSGFRIVDVTLPAGARIAYEFSERDAGIPQQIWVREGSIEVSVGKLTHRLAADDCLAMRLDAPVALRNRTRKPARYTVVIASEPARVPRTKS